MKKNIILIIIILIISIGIGSYIYKKNKNTKVSNLLFSISDVSCDCISNTLNVYDDNTYKLIKNNSVKGESTLVGYYEFDVTNLISKIKTYKIDEENYINYKIEFPNDDSVLISKNSSVELNEFLDSLKIDNMFLD